MSQFVCKLQRLVFKRQIVPLKNPLKIIRILFAAPDQQPGADGLSARNFLQPCVTVLILRLNFSHIPAYLLRQTVHLKAQAASLISCQQLHDFRKQHSAVFRLQLLITHQGPLKRSCLRSFFGKTADIKLIGRPCIPAGEMIEHRSIAAVIHEIDPVRSQPIGQQFLQFFSRFLQGCGVKVLLRGNAQKKSPANDAASLFLQVHRRKLQRTILKGAGHTLVPPVELSPECGQHSIHRRRIFQNDLYSAGRLSAHQTIGLAEIPMRHFSFPPR